MRPERRVSSGKNDEKEVFSKKPAGKPRPQRTGRGKTARRRGKMPAASERRLSRRGGDLR